MIIMDMTVLRMDNEPACTTAIFFFHEFVFTFILVLNDCPFISKGLS